MDQPFMSAIILWPSSFPPKNWAYCQGQILPIAQNTALFSLLGTTFGGNGQTTFALPDFRGRTAVGTGQGPGLADIVLGEMTGSNSTTILITNMPIHNHQMMVSNAVGTSDDPTNNILGKSHVTTTGDGVSTYDAPNVANGTMAVQAIQPAGGSQPISIQNPLLGMNYIIALYGIYPSRN